jgi:hypothetical protein
MEKNKNVFPEVIAPFATSQNSNSIEIKLTSDVLITYAESLMSKTPHIKPLDEVLIEIKEGRYREEIEAIRDAFINSGKETANDLKVSLPVFYTSAILDGGLKTENIIEYVPIIQVDFDDVPQEQLETLINKVKASPFTLCCFISPKGNGLKVLVKVNNQQEEHKEVFKAVNAYYTEITGFDSDMSINNINRACFVSYDPDLYYNTSSALFEFEQEVTLERNSLDSIWSFTENRSEYIESNRNNFLFLFANNCNRKGIDYNETLDYSFYRALGLPKSQVEATVKSAYNNTYDHGTYRSNYPTIAAEGTKAAVTTEASEKYEYTGLSDELYSNLPDVIRPIFDSYEGSKRDFFLMSLLTSISGGLKNVCGRYGDKIPYTNLFTFIVAPAASGKGIMNKAKDLCDLYDKKLREEHRLGGLFIGGNTSLSRLIEIVAVNGGTGVMFESEADTVSNTFKQEWGDYSSFLRKSFENEMEQLSRKTNDEHTVLYDNRIAVLLSGTPNQIARLLKSSEDGLFSRFMFVIDKSEPKWKSQRPDFIAVDKQQEVEGNLRLNLRNLFNYYKENELEVRLSDDTWDEQDKIFSKLVDESNLNGYDDESSVIFRLGMIYFKICMILTALEESQKIDEDEVVYCSEKNAKIAMEICLLSYKNSVSILDQFQNNLNTPKNDNDLFFFNQLPNSFTRAEAVDLGKNSVKLSERAIDSKLKKWLKEGVLIQKKRGEYEKNK